MTGYNLSTLGVGSYLNWGTSKAASVASNIDYINVLRVSDAEYPSTLQNLASNVSKNPNATWEIGNEPDAAAPYQDHISAETYAERFFALATQIRALDPTAKIGFGTIIQATAVRVYYLQTAMNRLIKPDLAGSLPKALALIDVYTIHNFIINERPNDWGATVPIGFDPATWPAPFTITVMGGVVDETWKTHDINIFTAQLERFRQWMKSLGDQNKPLWITEYGSFIPPVSNTFIPVSDQDTTTFMKQTFDFMLGYKDPNLGFASDDNRLAQRWIWYSLNDQIDLYGGSLYNPIFHQITYVGQQFIQYDPPRSAVPIVPSDVYAVPAGLSIRGINRSSSGIDYQVSVKVSNAVSTDYLTGVQVNLYDGGQQVGSAQVILPRCGGISSIPFTLLSQKPGSNHTYSVQVQLLPAFGSDMNPANNQMVYSPVILPDNHFILLPAVLR